MKTILANYFFMIIMFLSYGCAQKNIDFMNEGKKILSANKIDKTELKKAIGYFKTELKNNPNSLEAQINLAITYGKMSEGDSSLIVFSKAIESNNKEAEDLYIGRGMQRFIMKDYSGSIQDFKDALRYDSKNNQAYNLIITSKIWQKYNVNGIWSKFEKEDISSIINEVYPIDITNKSSVEEFINDKEMYSYCK